MPYIPQEDRRYLDPFINELAAHLTTYGELNYAITRLVHDYLPQELSYDVLNSLVGVFDCAKHEFIRTVLNDYEELKRKENGDI
jgi:hypothetical protein